MGVKMILYKKYKEKDHKPLSPAPTYVPTPEGCSIISAEGLDFRVRYGAG